jgi:uncharacterized glyoxalase superfamily protein PhnB
MTIRPGFHTLTPYLTAPDADALVAFARRALDAEETMRAPGGSGGMHVELRIGDSMLMVGSKEGAPTTAMLYLYVVDPDAAYTRAVDAGAKSVMAPTDTGDGERRAGVIDRWGNHWYFGRPK